MHVCVCARECVYVCVCEHVCVCVACARMQVRVCESVCVCTRMFYKKQLTHTFMAIFQLSHIIVLKSSKHCLFKQSQIGETKKTYFHGCMSTATHHNTL